MPKASKCPKCETTNRFEIALFEIDGAKFKHYFVQCSSCGCVVGVLDYYNIGARIDQLAKKLNIDLDR